MTEAESMRPMLGISARSNLLPQRMQEPQAKRSIKSSFFVKNELWVATPFGSTLAHPEFTVEASVAESSGEVKSAFLATRIGLLKSKMRRLSQLCVLQVSDS
jgi:hypothetical protein